MAQITPTVSQADLDSETASKVLQLTIELIETRQQKKQQSEAIMTKSNVLKKKYKNLLLTLLTQKKMRDIRLSINNELIRVYPKRYD